MPSGSLRVAAAAEAAEWMDGLWDGRQSGSPHGYLRSRARAPLAARRDSIFCGVVFELAIVVVIEELN